MSIGHHAWLWCLSWSGPGHILRIEACLEGSVLSLLWESWAVQLLPMKGTDFFFWDRVSLNSPVCPGTHSVDQAALELRNLPASASQVLWLKVSFLKRRHEICSIGNWFCSLSCHPDNTVSPFPPIINLFLFVLCVGWCRVMAAFTLYIGLAFPLP
jgi:hypothetical protein